MPRRRPLKWYDDRDGGMLPNCTRCVNLLFAPMFGEAVYSVGIEYHGDPADLAKRTIDAYHANGHTGPPAART